MEIENIKMIIFDVDGTLAETDDYYVEKGTAIIQKIIPQSNKNHVEKIARPVVMAGETILHGFYRLLDMIGLDSVISNIHSKISVNDVYKYKEVAGMRETINLLRKKYNLGIITSGGHQSTEAFLKKFDLKKSIKYVVSAEDCRFIKPHPEPVIKIAGEAGVMPENCMLVGDTIFDIICARRAGAYVVTVKSGFDTERFLKWHKADMLLDSINDLPQALGLEIKRTQQKP